MAAWQARCRFGSSGYRAGDATPQGGHAAEPRGWHRTPRHGEQIGVRSRRAV